VYVPDGWWKHRRSAAHLHRNEWTLVLLCQMNFSNVSTISAGLIAYSFHCFFVYKILLMSYIHVCED
jgi:hypothetical protein